MNGLASAYHNNGQYDRAIEYLERSLCIQKTTLGEMHVATASTINLMATI